MKHIWTVFCRNVLEDKNSGNLSLVDIVDRIGFGADLPDERPYLLPLPSPHYIVSAWMKPSEDYQENGETRIRFISPDGSELLNHVQRLELRSGVKLFVSGQVGSLPYTVNGAYEFEIAYGSDDNWTVIARIPLVIVHSQPENDEEVIESTEQNSS